jgi:hypothetical protein
VAVGDAVGGAVVGEGNGKGTAVAEGDGEGTAVGEGGNVASTTVVAVDCTAVSRAVVAVSTLLGDGAGCGWLAQALESKARINTPPRSKFCKVGLSTSKFLALRGFATPERRLQTGFEQSKFDLLGLSFFVIIETVCIISLLVPNL